ncbi:ubiquinol-cytochrome C reductase complex 14kD subunit-domain-containing protein [Chytriomyces sp. MP71]|nr:ubiquinol-cytochrome C reductase complex 14kD subunit-domain-containing protein [Chytriomyces sp. MP71]
MSTSVGGFIGSNLLSSLRTFRGSKALAAFNDWHAGAMGHRALGLKMDDLIPDEGPIVQEALRRLPPSEIQERLFRYRRAYSLSIVQQELEAKDQISAAEVCSRIIVCENSGQIDDLSETAVNQRLERPKLDSL